MIKKISLYIIILCLIFNISPCLAEENYKTLPEYYYTECPQQGIIERDKFEWNFYFNIYKPYNYDDNTQYDLVILLNGLGGNDLDLLTNDRPTVLGKIKMKNIYDWLIYNDEINPILIVTVNAETFIARDTRKLISYIRENYNIKEGKDHIWLGGLSLGCNITLSNIFINKDIIGNFLLLSGSREIEDLLDILSKEKEKYAINNLYISCGGDEGLLKINTYYYKELSKYSKNITMMVYDGYYHDWNTWTNSINDLLQLYFKNITPTTTTLRNVILNIVNKVNNIV